jgi:hypothetical protein
MTYKTKRKHSKDVKNVMWRYIIVARIEKQMFIENHDSDGI